MDVSIDFNFLIERKKGAEFTLRKHWKYCPKNQTVKDGILFNNEFLSKQMKSLMLPQNKPGRVKFTLLLI